MDKISTGINELDSLIDSLYAGNNIMESRCKTGRVSIQKKNKYQYVGIKEVRGILNSETYYELILNSSNDRTKTDY